MPLTVNARTMDAGGSVFFFFQAEDGIRDYKVTGVQTCALPIFDRGGLLQVGPESAGSVPGPACYGQGNTRPTLTDAQVVLGRINAQRPLGGELKSLDVEAARCAIAEHVGEPLKLSTDDAAAAVV